MADVVMTLSNGDPVLPAVTCLTHLLACAIDCSVDSGSDNLFEFDDGGGNHRSDSSGSSTGGYCLVPVNKARPVAEQLRECLDRARLPLDNGWLQLLRLMVRVACLFAGRFRKTTE